MWKLNKVGMFIPQTYKIIASYFRYINSYLLIKNVVTSYIKLIDRMN